MKRKGTRALFALAIAVLLSSFPAGSARAFASNEYEPISLGTDVNVSSRFFEVLFGKKDTQKDNAVNEIMLCPGGDVFGAKIKENKITVMQSAHTTGIKQGDILLSINEENVFSLEDVKVIASKLKGEPITLTLLRGDEEYSVRVNPVIEDDGCKLGLSLRDSTAGIGTVTYIEPQSGAFAGLGHGICDAESGKLCELTSGSITGVVLGGVKRGEAGKPGELCGVLTSSIRGELYSNTECGVFGAVNGTINNTAVLPIGRRSSVHAGDATIISTVKNGKKCEFAVKIFDIDENSAGTKSFKIKVTDPTLISLTGGIVRGMSGSPVIQDGKLIGAVTHVMVADPTEGYGIFIENMLDASMKSMGRRAA